MTILDELNNKYAESELRTLLLNWETGYSDEDPIDAYARSIVKDCANQPDLNYSIIKRFMKSEWLAANHAVDYLEREKHRFASDVLNEFLVNYF